MLAESSDFLQVIKIYGKTQGVGEKSLKIELVVVGVILAAFIGFSIRTILEHPLGSGGLQFLGAPIGAMVTLSVLIRAEALKSPATN